MTIGLMCVAGTHNVGDDLIQDTLCTHLAAAIPGVHIERLTYALSADYPERYIRSLWANPRAVFMGLDALLIGPGGMFPGMAEQAAWAPAEVWFDLSRLAAVPSFGVGLGYTPAHARSSSAEDLTRTWLEALRWSWVRDSLLGAMLPDGRGGIYPDASYLLAPEFLEMRVPADQRSGTVIVPCSDVPSLRRALCNAAVTYARDDEPVTLLSATAGSGETDRRLCEEMARGAGFDFCTDVLPWREFAARIARSRFVISSRAHPAIIADMLGVPFVSMDPLGKWLPIAAVCGAQGPARSPEAIMETHAQALAGLSGLVQRITQPHTYHDGSHLP